MKYKEYFIVLKSDGLLNMALTVKESFADYFQGITTINLASLNSNMGSNSLN